LYSAICDLLKRNRAHKKTRRHSVGGGLFKNRAVWKFDPYVPRLPPNEVGRQQQQGQPQSARLKLWGVIATNYTTRRLLAIAEAERYRSD
jgi:hypothetical protein